MAAKETKADKPDLEAMTIEQRIKWEYEHVPDSIQTIARSHRMSVDEVLAIIEQKELTVVETVGDMVDQSEAGPGVQLETGKQHYVTYTTD